MPTGDLARGLFWGGFLPKEPFDSQLFALLALLALGHDHGADAKQRELKLCLSKEKLLGSIFSLVSGCLESVVWEMSRVCPSKAGL